MTSIGGGNVFVSIAGAAAAFGLTVGGVDLLTFFGRVACDLCFSLGLVGMSTRMEEGAKDHMFHQLEEELGVGSRLNSENWVM